MSNIDGDYKRSLMEDYYNLIAQNKVKKVILPFGELTLTEGNDTRNCNPWLEYSWKMFVEESNVFLMEANWNLDRYETEQKICDRWQRTCTDGWDLADISKLRNRIENDNHRRAEYCEEDDDIGMESMNQDINDCTLALFALANSTDMRVTGLLIANAYVDYIYETAKKKVKIYNCEYSADDSTRSVDSYYIIYTIDDDFYVLVRYSKEKKSTRFMIETLSRGSELIEIERKLKYYM